MWSQSLVWGQVGVLEAQLWLDRVMWQVTETAHNYGPPSKSTHLLQWWIEANYSGGLETKIAFSHWLFSLIIDNFRTLGSTMCICKSLINLIIESKESKLRQKGLISIWSANFLIKYFSKLFWRRMKALFYLLLTSGVC